VREGHDCVGSRAEPRVNVRPQPAIPKPALSRHGGHLPPALPEPTIQDHLDT